MSIRVGAFKTLEEARAILALPESHVHYFWQYYPYMKSITLFVGGKAQGRITERVFSKIENMGFSIKRTFLEGKPKKSKLRQ